MCAGVFALGCPLYRQTVGATMFQYAMHEPQSRKGDSRTIATVQSVIFVARVMDERMWRLVPAQAAREQGTRLVTKKDGEQ